MAATCLQRSRYESVFYFRQDSTGPTRHCQTSVVYTTLLACVCHNAVVLARGLAAKTGSLARFVK